MFFLFAFAFTALSVSAAESSNLTAKQNFGIGGEIVIGGGIGAMGLDWDNYDWNQLGGIQYGGCGCRNWCDQCQDFGFYSGRGYPPQNPGCMTNPFAYGCPRGPVLPPQVPTIPQCGPNIVGCPGGPIFEGCTQQFGQFTPGCPMPMGGPQGVVPIPGCTPGIAGCPGGPPIPGCPGGMIVPGCQFAPNVPGCPQGPIPAGCFPQVPYVRNFQAVNKLAMALAKVNETAESGNTTSTTVPSTETQTPSSEPSASSTPSIVGQETLNSTTTTTTVASTNGAAINSFRVASIVFLISLMF